MKILKIQWLVISMCCSIACNAQASLASEDIIEDVAVNVRGEAQKYTLVRDARQKDQWYYLPANIRLYEKTASSGRQEPEFNLIKYQFKNPRNPQEMLEGGILQFAVNMSPENEAFTQLEAAIRKRAKIASVRLSGLPLKCATVNLITPKGEFVADGAQTEGIAPTQSNQKMIFSIPLTRIGADVYDALTNSNTGMGVAVSYKYNGLTPPAGFKVTVDWEQTYKFLSKDKKTAGSVGLSGTLSSFGLGGSVGYAKITKDIKQTLIDNKCISIEATTGESFTTEQMEKYLDPIIQKIGEELLDKAEMSNSIDTMMLSDALNENLAPGGGGSKISQFLSFSGSKKVLMKNINIVKKGKQEYDFRINQLVERTSIAGGFVGLGKYNKEVKDRLVTIVPQGKWESAFFILPTVSDDENIGIGQVDLQVGLKNKGKAYNTQVVMWSKEKGWVDKDGKQRSLIAFPLMEFANKDEELKNLSFDLLAKITVGREVLEVRQDIKTINGESAVSTPLSLVDVVSVIPDMLSFNLLNNQSQLDFANITLTDGQRKFSKSLRPMSQSGTPAPPKPIYWLVAKPNTLTSNVKADIIFNLHDGSTVKWKQNQRNLYDPEVGLEILLRDTDYAHNK
jgi:hypothetical protein